MSPADPPVEHGFKAGWFQTGIYRVLCLCGERFSGSDSATAHVYWREHMADPDAGEVEK